jgi:hypothetical protein
MKPKKSKRLESIKAAHEVEKTRSSSRMEDYLEIIAELVSIFNGILINQYYSNIFKIFLVLLAGIVLLISYKFLEYEKLDT